MTTVLLFHHAQGQTKGFLGFADELREAGHTVHTPDLYDGQTFEDFDEGVGYAKEVGFGEILRRGVAVADDMPADVVYAGFSLGVMPAQSLAQQRAGARGAILCSAAFPTDEFGGVWPPSVPLQIHMARTRRERASAVRCSSFVRSGPCSSGSPSSVGSCGRILSGP